MTGLTSLLLRRIAEQGPLTIADYMAECLLHPQYGYYSTRDPLGPAGDFITAPEISQMFGELIGLSLAQAWLDQGQPSDIALVEFGPGRGTLMADMLRATTRVPGFHDALHLHLVEVSPTLRARQQETLADWPIAFLSSSSELPEDLPIFAVANEFFDALPIRQFIRDGDGWCERLVGERDGELAFGRGPRTEQPVLSHRLEDTRDGDLVEFCPSGTMAASDLGTGIARNGGAALVIDYGDWRSLGDTLQAVRSHEAANVLEGPGESDLTAHVDFEALATAAPCAHSRLTTQGVFLERLGITARAEVLAGAADGPARDDIIHAHRRLTHPAEMGSVFKVMSLHPSGTHPPAGLDP